MSVLLRNRFKFFLGTLIFLFITLPILLDILDPSSRRYVFLGVALATKVGGILAVSARRSTLWIALALGFGSLVMELIPGHAPSKEIAVGQHLIRMAFIAVVIVEIFRELFIPRLVTFEVLAAALSVYLLIGVLWENIFAILEILRPGSFLDAVKLGDFLPQTAGTPNRDLTFFYFSFTTLTGVGFGDIVPATSVARMFAVTEAILGQGYLLVMVSRLVGVQVAQSTASPITVSKVEDTGKRPGERE